MNVTEFDKNMRALLGESEPWDSDGIQIDCGGDIKKALVSLDCMSGALERAKETGAGLIVTHHPLIFRPLSSIKASDSVGGRALAACRAGISVVAYHTCLDIAAGGVNDSLALALGIKNARPFVPYGRIGTVRQTAFTAFARKCEKALGVRAQNALDCGVPVHKIALVSGSGKSEVKSAHEAGADTFVTGEVTHDAMIDCREYGMNLLCLTHFATENVVLPFLAEQVKRFVPEVVFYGV
ncbi:MAG: Nif3-like dinuclear metal center hexameric protein [Clostridia bacterium]|nr:Nif3-like dinuclear metal center hexameric protein [Clostridia bacterium]